MNALRDIEFDGVDPLTLIALEELARKQHMAEALRAQVEQEKFAKHCREMKSIDGMGAVRRNIDAFAFHDWAVKLGSYECWSDRGFNRYIDKLAPETKVRSYGTKIQVGWERPCEFPPRFRKSYSPELTKEEDKC